MLDEKRDEKLLQVLPDYLTDEIMFAREQGSIPFSRSPSLAPAYCSIIILLASQPISAEESGITLALDVHEHDFLLFPRNYKISCSPKCLSLICRPSSQHH